jgi:hypothetical protein
MRLESIVSYEIGGCYSVKQSLASKVYQMNKRIRKMINTFA